MTTSQLVSPTSHPCKFFAFAPFSILIEDPEGNMVRSVDVYSLYTVYASMRYRERGRLFSRDPADARDVPAGPPVAPPSAAGKFSATRNVEDGREVKRPTLE